MIETAKMSDRGQVIIPKNIRDAIGAEKDALLAFSVEGDTILVKKLDLIETFRKIRASTVKVSTDNIVDEIHEIRKELRKSRNRH